MDAAKAIQVRQRARQEVARLRKLSEKMEVEEWTREQMRRSDEYRAWVATQLAGGPMAAKSAGEWVSGARDGVACKVMVKRGDLSDD